MDCGPTCLKMIANHYGRNYSLPFLRDLCNLAHAGVSLMGISEAAEKIGFHTIGASVSFERLVKEVPLPCIAHWNQQHFIVVYKITRKYVYVADPGYGTVKYKHEEFQKYWLSHYREVENEEEGQAEETKQEEQSENGIVLLIEPTPLFYENELDEDAGQGHFFNQSFKRYTGANCMKADFFGCLTNPSVPFPHTIGSRFWY